jgi:hypothetical protein
MTPLKLKPSVLGKAAERHYSPRAEPQITESPRREPVPSLRLGGPEMESYLREEQRKRDYGHGIPSWSVYYHGERQPPLKSPPRPAHEGSSPRCEDKSAKMAAEYRHSHSNFVKDAIKTLLDDTSEPSPPIDAAEAAANALADACDLDGDGHLDINEIVSAIMRRGHLLKPVGLSLASTELQVLEMFRQADADGNGFVTRAELVAFMKQHRAGKQGLHDMQSRAAVCGQHVGPVVPKREFGAPLVASAYPRLSPRFSPRNSAIW